MLLQTTPIRRDSNMGLDSIPYTKEGYARALEMFAVKTSDSQREEVFAAMDATSRDRLRVHASELKPLVDDSDADPTTWDDDRFESAAIVLSHAARISFASLHRSLRLHNIREVAAPRGVYPSTIKDAIAMSDFQAAAVERTRSAVEHVVRLCVADEMRRKNREVKTRPRPQRKKRATPSKSTAEQPQNAA